MVRIPRFEPQVAPAMEDQPFSSGDGYAAQGVALQKLGHGMSDFGKGLDAWDKKADAEAEKENSYLDQLNLFEKQREAQQVYDDFKVEKESDPEYNWQNFANEAKGRVGDVYGGFRPSSKAFAGPRGSLTSPS